jgi:VanZ family protein
VKAASQPAVAHRWWLLPAAYVIFLAYQSLVGENVWNCKRELSRPFVSWATLSFSDLLANFLAYIPFGFLLAAPKVRSRVAWALCFATLLGFFLSSLMETMQICLPGRVPAVHDLLANTFGTFAGAVMAWIWHFWDEGRVRSYSARDDLPLVLKSAALKSLVILATLTWIAYQTKPWVFTFDVGQLRANFSWLKRLTEAPWSWFGFSKHFCAWMALLMAWRLSASPLSGSIQAPVNNAPWLRWALGSLGVAVAMQMGLETRALGPEEILGMALALLFVSLCSLVLGSRRHVQPLLSTWVLVFAFATVLAYQLEPNYAFAFNVKKFSLLPVIGTAQLIHAIDYALFFAWFGVMVAVAACARSRSHLRFQKLTSLSKLRDNSDQGSSRFALGWALPLAAAVGVLATEVVQFWIPGRGIDSSPIIFTLLGYWFANHLIFRLKPTS